MKLTDFLIEILEKNPLLNGFVCAKLRDGKLQFSLPGFSKSGEIWLSQDANDTIFAEARYVETTEIKDYEDIVWLAWDWFLRYSDRDTFSAPSEFWINDFKRLNLIEEVKETKYKIKK